MLNSLKLSQVYNEKICHDFTGSIGVIDNAIGLIKTIDYQEKATKLVQDSTNRLMSYLQFHRYVYSLHSEGNKIAIAEINRLSSDFLKSKNHNIELVFTRLIITNIDDNIAQIIMCLIVGASSHIYRDAVIKIELEIQNDNFVGIKIVVTSPNLRLDQDRADILLGNRTIDDVSIENVHEYYTYNLITEYGYKLAITPSTDSVEYILVGSLLAIA